MSCTARPDTSRTLMPLFQNAGPETQNTLATSDPAYSPFQLARVTAWVESRSSSPLIHSTALFYLLISLSPSTPSTPSLPCNPTRS